MARCIIPGRIEILDTTPRVILDAGHNVQSATALTDFLKEQGISRVTLVFGVLADKNYRKLVALLKPFAKTVLLTEPLSKRALPVEKLLPLFRDKRNPPVPTEVQMIPSLEETIAHAWQKGNDILGTGSFYLVGEARRLILDTSDNKRDTLPEVGEKNG